MGRVVKKIGRVGKKIGRVGKKIGRVRALIIGRVLECLVYTLLGPVLYFY